MFIMTLFILWSLTLRLLYFLFSIIQQSYGIKSSKKPSRFSSYGPPSYPVIGCLISFYKNQHRLLDWYTDMLSTSPSQTIVVSRLGLRRRIIVTANPANVEYILKTNFSNFPKGKPLTEFLGDLLGCGIFNVDGELWLTQRKLASHEFSTKSLREFVVKTLEDEVEQRLLPLLEEAAESQRVLDMQDVLRRFAFDTVCKVSLGTDPFCLDLARPVPALVEAFDCASEISARRATSPMYFIWKLKRALCVGSENKLKDAIKVVHDSVQEIVNNKRKILQTNEGKNCGNDLLSRMLLAGHDEEVARDMVISFILAGRDTTSSAMTWLFWLLSKHPSIKEKIVFEVADVLNNGTSSTESTTNADSTLGFEDLNEMKFLRACLCESMRLYPPVPWDSKHAEAGTVLPDGTWVGEGDRVTYFPYGMGRMKELWGKDRFEFNPDRWFCEERGSDGSDNERVMKVVSPYKYPVFQAGPRVCLGKEMAFIQMKYVMASVLRRFEITPVCDLEQPVFVPLLTAHMAGGLKVLIQKRS
ncbi:cytochrome P450 94B3-like [Argentina anserina]|uniref:cytochrome P450 94B3-like n=1 Tax=Argentina anserina TaxID=57926 RepID=UPI002176697F|nr:cytochrome P450 94B3-like [Potentilla anserina]